MGGPGVIKVDRTRLLELVREDPDASLPELRVRPGLACAISTICGALKRLGWSLNEIEMVFSEIKQRLRSTACRARQTLG